MTANTDIQSALITGANSGIGKEIARLLALRPGVRKIYLGCRNAAKGQEARRSLEAETGKRVFDVLLIDVSDIASVREAAKVLPESIDALFLNAGGQGGDTPRKLTKDGATELFASNTLGHALLLEELIQAKKLRHTAVLTGSEAARGVKKLGLKKPVFEHASVDEFVTVVNGKFFDGKKFDLQLDYGQAKYLGTLWMSAMARKHPELKLLTVSPGGTQGTAVAKSMPKILRLINDHIALPYVLPLLGLAHSLETGSQRMVDGANEPRFKSGRFYASAERTLTGPLVDQSEINRDFAREDFQDKAYQAIQRFYR